MPGQTAAQIVRTAQADRRTVNHGGEPARVVHRVPGQRIRIAGCVDAANVGDVRTGLHDAVDLGTGELVVEVADFQLGDATGLGALLGAHRRADRAGRTLVLTEVPAALQRILAYTRLGRVLATRDTAPISL